MHQSCKKFIGTSTTRSLPFSFAAPGAACDDAEWLEPEMMGDDQCGATCGSSLTTENLEPATKDAMLSSFAAWSAASGQAFSHTKSKIQPLEISATSAICMRYSFAASAAQLADSTRAMKTKTRVQHLIRNRYYDPHTGRFTSEDPIGFKADANFYRYVRNNPIIIKDPFGLCSCSDPCPTGEWTFDSVGGSVALVGYASLSIGKISCKGNSSVSRWAHMGCEGIGLIVGGGLGFDIQVHGSMSGPCRPEDLGPFTTKGYLGSIGPVTVSGPKGGVSNIGIGKTIGAGYAGVECHIHPF